MVPSWQINDGSAERREGKVVVALPEHNTVNVFLSLSRLIREGGLISLDLHWKSTEGIGKVLGNGMDLRDTQWLLNWIEE